MNWLASLFCSPQCRAALVLLRRPDEWKLTKISTAVGSLNILRHTCGARVEVILTRGRTISINRKDVGFWDDVLLWPAVEPLINAAAHKVRREGDAALFAAAALK